MENYRTIRVMADKVDTASVDASPLCFVVGPIGKDSSPERKHSDLLLNLIIKHVLQRSEFEFRVRRADEDADPGMIGDRVVSDIIHADLVVADLTDLNPNVFYEIGIRHSTEKPTVHMARMGTALPFDNVTHRTIFFDLTDWQNIEQARSRLAEAVRTTKRSDYKVSNPITQANASFKMRQSADPRDQVVAELGERMSKLEGAFTVPAHAQIQTVDPRFDTSTIMNLARNLKFPDERHAIEYYRTITESSPRQAREFVAAIKSDRKIEAIKLFRSTMQVSLVSAKDFVEQVLAYMNLF
jgi:ribosomal protein L7/L12